MKQRFLSQGLDGFTDIQVLELLLFYAVARQDTNPIAHDLLQRFGSLSQVLEAEPEELKKVKGIGENAATLLHLIPQLGRYYQMDKNRKRRQLVTLEECGEYLLPFFYGRNRETVCILCLDSKCEVLCCREIEEGGINSARISVRKVVEAALNANASTVILAHNHPSGIAIPSDEDIQTTVRIASALRNVEIHLADHIVVGGGDYVSMAQSGILYG